jgi:hypothetical protein
MAGLWLHSDDPFIISEGFQNSNDILGYINTPLGTIKGFIILFMPNETYTSKPQLGPGVVGVGTGRAIQRAGNSFVRGIDGSHVSSDSATRASC